MSLLIKATTDSAKFFKRNKKGVLTYRMDIDEIISQFEDEMLAIDYSEASYEQMDMLEEILNERTEIRPHGDMTYSEHMKNYITDDFVFLVGGTVHASSYKKHVTNCRPTIIPIKDVIKAAGEDRKAAISETEFDSMF